MTQNIKQSHKPFNLRAALEGAPVITKIGDEVVRIVHLPEAAPSSRVVAVFDNGELNHYFENGRYDEELESNIDLVMVSTTKTGWVNVHKDYSNNYFSSNIYTTQEEALIGKKSYSYITTTKIEWEE